MKRTFTIKFELPNDSNPAWRMSITSALLRLIDKWAKDAGINVTHTWSFDDMHPEETPDSLARTTPWSRSNWEYALGVVAEEPRITWATVIEISRKLGMSPNDVARRLKSTLEEYDRVGGSAG